MRTTILTYLFIAAMATVAGFLLRDGIYDIIKRVIPVSVCDGAGSPGKGCK